MLRYFLLIKSETFILEYGYTYLLIKMKIGISGATCSGKTTFLDYLRFNLPNLRKEIELISERAMECPYPLNNNGGFRTQWWIQSNQIQKEYEAQQRVKVVITDRTVFDAIPYLMISEHNEKELRMAMKTAKQWNELYPYDFIFYFAPIPIKGMSEYVATKFQQEIDKNLRTVYSLNIPHEHIIYVPVQEKLKRCEQTYQTLIKIIGE